MTLRPRLTAGLPFRHMLHFYCNHFKEKSKRQRFPMKENLSVI
jgi:hypothetical protein